MFTNTYRIKSDLKLVRGLNRMTIAELAEALSVGVASVNRWDNGKVTIDKENLEKFYSYAYNSGIMLNDIKSQFYKEDLKKNEILLFHGAKALIEGPVKTDVSRDRNDFGKGFYCGESFRQAALFVSAFPESSVYMMSFNTAGLKKAQYSVDREWLMTIACYRRRLDGVLSDEAVNSCKQKSESADYIIAPIADNRMYQIINRFIDGEITDAQCIHALSATDLGMQYVIKTSKAASRIILLERCYMCEKEKLAYSERRAEDIKSADNKVRAAFIKYKRQGKYIDELI